MQNESLKQIIETEVKQTTVLDLTEIWTTETKTGEVTEKKQRPYTDKGRQGLFIPEGRETKVRTRHR